jgi:transcriptional regulator with XRE-family HTH domain
MGSGMISWIRQRRSAPRAHEPTGTDDMTHPIDKHVGSRIRYGRWMRGKSQHDLGDAVECRFQQIQKYETGMNRVSASRLWDIAKALDLPITYFFEGQEQPGLMLSTFPDRGSAELLRIWMSLPDRQKQALLSLAKSMTDMDR